MIILTPARIAEICARHLSDAERSVCVEASLRRSAETAAAANLLAHSGGFDGEAEVAAWWLEACRAALRGGSS